MIIRETGILEEREVWMSWDYNFELQGQSNLL